MTPGIYESKKIMGHTLITPGSENSLDWQASQEIKIISIIPMDHNFEHLF